MRSVAFFLAFLVFVQSASATTSQEIDPRASLGVVQQWIYNYRAKPDYGHIPAAVRVLFHAQTFKEPENAGIYLGFIAGAIGVEPGEGRATRQQLLPGAGGRRMGDRPRDRLFRTAGLAQPVAQGRAENAGTAGDDRRLSRRQAADAVRHSAGRKAARHDRQGARACSPRIPSPRTTRRCKSADHFRQQSGSARHAVGLLLRDRLASADRAHHRRCCPGAKSHDTVDKLTVGSMARYTLASYAVRDTGLREYLRERTQGAADAVKVPLTEVIEAADTVQLGAVRKDALAAVDELKAKGSDSRRNLDFWGQVGVGAVALGCVSAAALGAGRGRHSLRDRRLRRPGPAVVLGKQQSSAVPA